MKQGEVVEIITPKKVVLKGIWFGPKKAKRTIVLVHGLSASAFSMQGLVQAFLKDGTAVLVFNNRGHEVISSISYATGNDRLLSGGAHERFSDCADDIQGAINFAKRQGTKNVFLAGHSTGCQKSVYWASQHGGGRGVEGIILLAPISDWASDMKLIGAKKVARAVRVARLLVGKGKKHALLPEGVWHQVYDAQRFLSLHDPDSIEEIFTYSQPGKTPHTLKRARKPICVFLAEKDEYGDRPASKIAKWFEANLRNGDVIIVPRVKHSFRGAEKEIAETVREWAEAL